MLMSRLFSQTRRRSSPRMPNNPATSLLIRAGHIRPWQRRHLPACRWRRSLAKIEAIMRLRSTNAIGGQEVSMPVVQPAELWRRPGAQPRSAARWGASRISRNGYGGYDP